MGELRARDIRAVREQLGREPTTDFSVVARCAPDGHPLVIRNAPFDAEGKPFPTRFWLTCPDAVKAVSRLEAAGEIARWNERLERDADLRSLVSIAHSAYAAERDLDGAGTPPGTIVAPPAVPFGGVGGTRVGVKCLHAHYANHLAGGFDPVGAAVAEQVGAYHALPAGWTCVAAVDQGTNSTRLLVLGAASAEAAPTELARDMVITRLGQDVDASGRLTDAAMRRAAVTIARFGKRARALGASRVRVAATSAVRDAANRDDFAREIAALGLDLEVLSGEEEAHLTFAGATAGLDAPAPFLVLDIGGGSTEFVLGDADGVRHAISTQMGSVRLTERCVRHDPVTDAELEALRAEVHAVLDVVERSVPVRAARTLVAVAGTTTTVQGIALGLPRYDPDLIHRSTLATDDARAVLARLAREPREDRAAHPVMPRGREEVIVAGAVILVETMARFGFREALVSEADILDGLAVGALRLR